MQSFANEPEAAEELELPMAEIPPNLGELLAISNLEAGFIVQFDFQAD